MRRVVLIGRREIVAYASTPSFWAALLIGPLLLALAALGAGGLGGAKPSGQPAAIRVIAEPRLAAAAIGALSEAARLEGRVVELQASPGTRAASTTLRVVARAAGDVAVRVEGRRLSPLDLALLRRDLAAAAGRPSLAPVEVVQPPPPPSPAPDPGRFARFAMSTVLWLVLVGSLGMLLQAIVRERSNRALESLLAAARPSEIVLGKLAGVGVLSMLVVAIWLAGGALVAASPLGATVAARMLLQGFGDLAGLAAVAGLFLLAFAMYGSALIGLGALARDMPAAQNLSRPVFALLLAVFFVALGQLNGMGADRLPALALFPPFAPFVLILAKPGAIGGLHLALSAAGMVTSTLAGVWLAALALRGEAPRLRRSALGVRPRPRSAA